MGSFFEKEHIQSCGMKFALKFENRGLNCAKKLTSGREQSIWFALLTVQVQFGNFVCNVNSI